MATTRRDTPGNPASQTPPPRNELTARELVDLLHRRTVDELIVVEEEPGRYLLQARISWRAGRSTVMGTRGPRTYRNLNTLVTHLKTLDIGSTLVRLELRT
ncbi:hypothetical protein [Variovorax saccharolyticus]|uniref:hypothetical protein n=1 Tax=Variovorax saccharolyticus TaxID=3053516 RepID=UPI002575AEFA|nr:hypothetical protein [Variovorax sp. J31P216]MDM0030362.1 hypothetical protein [Variovorax sp. J31P216]